MAYGLVSLNSKPIRSIDFAIKDWAQARLNRKYTFDDFTSVSPLLMYGGLGFSGLRNENNFYKYYITGFSACALQYGLVYSIKRITNRNRPDNTNKFSFPSGHTSIAFAGAELVRLEYSNPWIIYSAYSLAAITAFMRIVNNRHWLSDVVMGAGIGFVSARLTHWVVPKISKYCIKEHNKTLSIQSF